MYVSITGIVQFYIRFTFLHGLGPLLETAVFSYNRDLLMRYYGAQTKLAAL